MNLFYQANTCLSYKCATSSSCARARAHIVGPSGNLAKRRRRRRWERIPANGQKRPSRGWSCRSSNRPREIDHLALLLHPHPPPLHPPPPHITVLRDSLSATNSPAAVPPCDSTIHPRARCIIVRPHRLAPTSSTCPEQAGAIPRTYTHRRRTRRRRVWLCAIAYASGYARALSPRRMYRVGVWRD